MIKKIILLNLLGQSLSAVGLYIFTRNIAVGLGVADYGYWASMRYIAEFLAIFLSLSFPQIFLLSKSGKEFDGIVVMAFFWCLIVLSVVIILLLASLSNIFTQKALEPIYIFVFISLFYHNVWKSSTIKNNYIYILVASGPGVFLVISNFFEINHVSTAAMWFSFGYLIFGLFAMIYIVHQGSFRNILKSNSSGFSENLSKLLILMVINGSYPLCNWIFLKIFSRNIGGAEAGVFSLSLYLVQSIMMFPINAASPLLTYFYSRRVSKEFNFGPLVVVFFISILISIFSIATFDLWINLILSNEYVKYMREFKFSLLLLPFFVVDKFILSVSQGEGGHFLFTLVLIKIIYTLISYFFLDGGFSYVSLLIFFAASNVMFYPFYIRWIWMRTR